MREEQFKRLLNTGTLMRLQDDNLDDGYQDKRFAAQAAFHHRYGFIFLVVSIRSSSFRIIWMKYQRPYLNALPRFPILCGGIHKC